MRYICQLCPTKRNKFRKMRPKNPRLPKIRFKSSSTNWPPRLTCWNVLITEARTSALSAAIAKRKKAETDVPIIAPTDCRYGKRFFKTTEVAAMTTDNAKTIVECPREKKKP